MKTLNSWVVAVIASSALATQANADILFAEPQENSPMQRSELTTGFEDNIHRNTVNNSVRPVFVQGSLINNSGTVAWLMAESVKTHNSVHHDSVVANGSVGRRVAITPIPPAGTQVRPISTFAQFAQNFKSAPQNHDHGGDIQASAPNEVAPKTSNMTLIGLFAFGQAGTGALLGAARRGLFFGRTRQQRCARLY